MIIRPNNTTLDVCQADRFSSLRGIFTTTSIIDRFLPEMLLSQWPHLILLLFLVPLDGRAQGAVGPVSDVNGQISQSVAEIGDGIEQPEQYAEVEVFFSSQDQIKSFERLELDIDHFHPALGVNSLVIPARELTQLEDGGFEYKVLEADVAKSIEQRNLAYFAKNPLIPPGKSTAGFELGSMGGFYTYAEVLDQLDEMKALYPSLITDRFSIGTTIEGRTIWAVKISDNPTVDESNAEAPVYFDALHHAREPASMATVINYMFHLLENYGSDPGINYIVNNREIFIVPVVNPDGYEYNRATNPNGGGMWRKNRRINAGSSCRGVDINRNYDTDWAGASSSNTCSDSYHGTAPFSEPEAQAIRDFTTSIGAPIAYTTHTSGGYWLGPDFSNNRADFAIHAELMNDCLQENEYIHGDANIILGYVSGTTQGWMYETLGSLTWTPEIGTTGFWPTPPEILNLVNQQIKPYEYACWIAGALADYQGFTLTSSQGLTSSAPLEFDIRIKNKGLTQTAQGVNVVVTTDNTGVTAYAGSQSYGNIASRAFGTNASSFSFNVASSVPVGTVVTFFVAVSQDGVVSDTDSFQLTVGEPTILFADDAESGSGNWSNGSSGSTWQTSTEDAYTGSNCFVDSRITHVTGTRTFGTNTSISLSGAANPRLEFAAKWSMYQKYTRLQISTDNGGSWSNLNASGMGTASGGPAFVGNERWTYQVVDLSSFIGQNVRFRFANFGGGTAPDGFYFDDFRVVDYAPAPTCSDGIQNGDETGVDCGGSCAVTCTTCSDGIQNGNETGIDCGGPDCAPCFTCSDGIQNGNETGIDCGGPDCAPCFTCSDGIQNGNETGVDCGGPDCAPCGTGCSPVIITSDDFEGGYGNWIDGGSDCVLTNNATYSNSGTLSVALRDNTSTSVMSTNNLDLSAYGEITVDFSYFPVSMDNASEDFWLQVSNNGGVTYTTVEEWNRGDEFQNNIRYFESVVIAGPFTSSTRIRFRCDASADGDLVYLDDIVLSACQGGTSSPTCTDGIQNGAETGIDCGGPDCSTCPSCNDGILNNGESAVDCGGPNCSACPSCNDGVLNNGETAIDCGGPNCAACPTCNDGIQNGNETGVDCGGPNCTSCPVTYCASSASSTQYEYIASVTLAGVTNTSGSNGGYGDFTAISAIPLSGTVGISLTPGFSGSAYNEGWVVYIDYNADGDFTDAGEQVIQLSGNSTVSGSINIPAGLSGASRMRIQMRYNTFNGNSCGTYAEGEVEDYSVVFGGGTKKVTPQINQNNVLGYDRTLNLFPNPASTQLTVSVSANYEKEGTFWSIYNATGRVVLQGQTTSEILRSGLNVNLRNLSSGVYYFTLNTTAERITKRFVIQP